MSSREPKRVPVSRRRFRLYWLVFSPGIKLVRRLILSLLWRDLRHGGTI